MKYSKTLLIFCLITYSIILAKKFETTLAPVVSTFEITDVKTKDNKLYVQGVLSKTRSCQFIDVIAYDDSMITRKLLQVNFLDTPVIVSRDTGLQSWGPWEIIPQTRNLTLLARHKCITGIVETQLFRGTL